MTKKKAAAVPSSDHLTATELDIESITKLARNAKDHDVPLIRQSMQRFSYADRLIVNSRTGRLLGGHGRVDALIATKKANNSPPRGIVVRDGKWFVPADLIDVPEEEEEAMALALNGTQEAGGWDEEERDEIIADQKDLTGTGFDREDGEDHSDVARVEEMPRESFWLLVRGPIGSQPDAIEALREKLAGIEGIDVQGSLVRGSQTSSDWGEEG